MISRRIFVIATAIKALLILPARAALQSPPTITRRDNCSFVTEIERNLREAVERGVLPAGHQETVHCPLCREFIIVSASAPLQQISV